MGQEVQSSRLSAEHTAEFSRRLAQETETVVRWGKEGRFVCAPPQIGMEIEGCLVDDQFRPVPINTKFLKLLEDPHATIELARFNVEFNPPPLPLTGSSFDDLRQMLDDIFLRARDAAERLRVRLLLAGILPTLTPGDLDIDLMSKSKRFRVFVKQFDKWQKEHMARVEIADNDGLVVGVNSVMMESVTTSQQIHIQIPEPGSAAYYNAAQMLAAPMAALCANSPFFMGRNLWAETRVPVFEQVLKPRFENAPPDVVPDDFFGSAYVDHSVLELFVRNHKQLPVMLPELYDDASRLPHMLLHNGTIWRWVRPVISFDQKSRPVLRLEFRAAPSGPTIADMIAQVAFFAGAVCALATNELKDNDGATAEARLPFTQARANFYRCARDGLEAEIQWLDGTRLPVTDLILNQLLPAAEGALTALGVDAAADELAIIHGRATNRQNGAAWQRAYVQQYSGGSPGLARMTDGYYRRQLQNHPVHTWGR